MYAHYIQEPSYDLNKFKFLRSTLLAIALVNACGYRGCPASATITTSIAFSAGLAVDHAAPASFAAFPSAFSLVTRMNTLPSLGQTSSPTTLRRARWRPLHKKPPTAFSDDTRHLATIRRSLCITLYNMRPGLGLTSCRRLLLEAPSTRWCSSVGI